MKKQRLTVVAAVIIRTRLVNKTSFKELCIVRDVDDGVWGLPGGKFENNTGETFKSCLLRELHDELRGPEFIITEKLGQKKGYTNTHNKPLQLIVYMVELEGGRITPGPEIGDIKWISKMEASRICTDKRFKISSLACKFIKEINERNLL